MRRFLKTIFPILFLGCVLFAMIGFRHLQTLDAQEMRLIEEFRERWIQEAKGPSLEKGPNRQQGGWALSTNAQGYFGSDYYAHPPGNGSATFTWSFKVKQTGRYEVFVNYASAFDRASNAPYTIHHTGGETVKMIDQRTGGGRWVSLGVYSYKKGETGRVILSNRANGFVIADAVRVIDKDNRSTKIILDNNRPGQRADTQSPSTDSR
ncbi:golvesin C-terminal-like domain-containing protein [Paludifilum halophilum]|uniref:Golvesin/Xly CBD-like domain-containing protein n=1 Tax=Paludifilum halophilum TaxID=1642702 RepID=A0A235BCE1_9BACL|nr:hypothetical protein [Paludifilum halophilum]OYD09930.1 hypothetical protein CHM34_02855 [Paludifilum halophilum]